MILIIDNQEREGCSASEMARALTARRKAVTVRKNDAIDLEEIDVIDPELIVLSPGYGYEPFEGICVPVIQRFAGRIPILGVGVGFQCVVAAFGGRLVRGRRIWNMVEDKATHDGRGVFRGLPSPIRVLRKHSTVVARETLPRVLKITATSSDGEIMGIRHRDHPVEGVAFRPVVGVGAQSQAEVLSERVYTFGDLLAGAKRFATPPGSRIEVVRVTDEILRSLRLDEENVYKLSADQFELLICDRLTAAGFEVSKAGHTFARDGGIDLLACPRFPVPFPYILAVQAKHHRQPITKTGARDVQQFAGAIMQREIQSGALITNTSFTPNAQWLAEHASKLLMLRDMRDIRRWLRDDFVGLAERRDLPSEIVLGRDVVVKVPEFLRISDLDRDASDED